MNKNEKRNARVFALKMAYAYEMTKNNDSLADNINIDNDQDNSSEEILNYGNELVNIYMKNIQEFDKWIVSKSSNWDISRIAFIDRIIIRLALSEMFYIDNVPEKVSIVEAVEIAKLYSTDDSSSFINGILDSIYNEKIKVNKSC